MVAIIYIVAIDNASVKRIKIGLVASPIFVAKLSYILAYERVVKSLRFGGLFFERVCVDDFAVFFTFYYGVNHIDKIFVEVGTSDLVIYVDPQRTYAEAKRAYDIPADKAEVE